MRESNKNDKNPRKEKQAGVHYDKHNDGNVRMRKGA
jgi:hypothetical protein